MVVCLLSSISLLKAADYNDSGNIIASAIAKGAGNFCFYAGVGLVAKAVSPFFEAMSENASEFTLRALEEEGKPLYIIGLATVAAWIPFAIARLTASSRISDRNKGVSSTINACVHGAAAVGAAVFVISCGDKIARLIG